MVALGFIGAFALFSEVLRRGMPFGVAATALLSAAIFDERLTPLMALGIVIVVAGVLVVEFGSQAAQRRFEVDEVPR